MFIELIPQRKSHGGEQKGGGESWEFFLLQKMIFFFSSVCWMEKKNLQFNFSAGKQSCFLPCFWPREQRAPGSQRRLSRHFGPSCRSPHLPGLCPHRLSVLLPKTCCSLPSSSRGTAGLGKCSCTDMKIERNT